MERDGAGITVEDEVIADVDLNCAGVALGGIKDEVVLARRYL